MPTPAAPKFKDIQESLQGNLKEAVKAFTERFHARAVVDVPASDFNLIYSVSDSESPKIIILKTDGVARGLDGTTAHAGGSGSASCTPLGRVHPSRREVARKHQRGVHVLVQLPRVRA